MYNGLDELLLKLPQEEKVSLLRDAFNENIQVFIDTSKIFLDNPVDRGGLPTEMVDKIFSEEMGKLSQNGKNIKFNTN